MQNPLWRYATGTYGVEEVAAACLALQDGFGLDVNLLLYAAWLAHGNQKLSVEHLVALEVSVSEWRDQVVRPLRTLRRQLQGKTGASDLYDGLKALELRAEREQLDRMYAFFRRAEPLSGAHRPLLDNLTVVAHFTRPAEARWKAAIDTLATLIPP